VLTVNHQKGYFTLSELDGTPLRGSVTGNRLKLYYARHPEAVTTSYEEQDVNIFEPFFGPPPREVDGMYVDLNHDIEEEEEEEEDEEAEGEGEGFADNTNNVAGRL
jgi:hypothetical protein